MPAPLGIFVAGTDTAVGKTQVVCWIAQQLTNQGLRVGICKPAVTGAVWRDGRWIWDDLERLRQSCCLPDRDDLICPYRWRLPLAPPAAYRLGKSQGEEVALPPPSIEGYLDAINCWEGLCDLLLVEGIGGLLCPINERDTVADLVRAWGRACLVVSRAGLGTINHTLLTLESATARGIKTMGVLLNRSTPTLDALAEASNPDELRCRTAIPILGPMGHASAGDVTTPDWIASIDWVRASQVTTESFRSPAPPARESQMVRTTNA